MPEQHCPSPDRPSPPAALFVTIFLVLAGFPLSRGPAEDEAGISGRRGDLLQPRTQPRQGPGFHLRATGSGSRLGGVSRTGRHLPQAGEDRRSAAHRERFPTFALVRTPDPRPDRLYYGKSYIYPLIAAPFVRAFGTNGFLVLHAVLMTLNILAAYTVPARAHGSSRGDRTGLRRRLLRRVRRAGLFRFPDARAPERFARALRVLSVVVERDGR